MESVYPARAVAAEPEGEVAPGAGGRIGQVQQRGDRGGLQLGPGPLQPD